MFVSPLPLRSSNLKSWISAKSVLLRHMCSGGVRGCLLCPSQIDMVWRERWNIHCAHHGFHSRSRTVLPAQTRFPWWPAERAPCPAQWTRPSDRAWTKDQPGCNMAKSNTCGAFQPPDHPIWYPDVKHPSSGTLCLTPVCGEALSPRPPSLSQGLLPFQKEQDVQTLWPLP